MTGQDASARASHVSGIRHLGMITDAGRMRMIDEDSILVLNVSLGTDSGIEEIRLLAVADGMGGHARGEVASRIALQTIFTTVAPRLYDGTSYTRLLERGIREANREIRDYVGKHAGSEGMGTTVVCALMKGDRVYLAHVGDSRAYVISDDGICGVTKDHSYVQALLDGGQITKDEARTHGMKNMITKAVGAGRDDKPDTVTFMLDHDEALLLCCDGVIAHLSDDDICGIVLQSGDPAEACRRMVDAANKRGGSDNISMVMLGAENNLLGPNREDPTLIRPIPRVRTG